jgi:hypothetical protein
MLIGDHLTGVTAGWQVRDERRRPSAYFLRFGSGLGSRPVPSDDGVIELAVVSTPKDYDVQEIGNAFADVVGHTIIGVERVWWLGGGGTGLYLRVGETGLVIASDEVAGRYEVDIFADDLGEEWGRESIE